MRPDTTWISESAGKQFEQQLPKSPTNGGADGDVVDHDNYRSLSDDTANTGAPEQSRRWVWGPGALRRTSN